MDTVKTDKIVDKTYYFLTFYSGNSKPGIIRNKKSLFIRTFFIFKNDPTNSIGLGYTNINFSDYTLIYDNEENDFCINQIFSKSTARSMWNAEDGIRLTKEEVMDPDTLKIYCEKLINNG